MQGVSPEAVCDHLHGLAASMAEHFSHEEELMRGVRYPSFGWRLAQHDTARRRIKLLTPMQMQRGCFFTSSPAGYTTILRSRTG